MGINVERLFCSFLNHLDYIDFQASSVSFYYITHPASVSAGAVVVAAL